MTDQKLNKPAFADANGLRQLHFGTSNIQGAMRLNDPVWLEFEYVQQMMMWTLFEQAPAHIVQLGLGAGSLTKFCFSHFQKSRITAIELSQAVIDLCRSDFALPPDNERLTVCAKDAMDFVIDPSNRNSVDILQVDLYDALAKGPALDSPEFYRGCADCLKPAGMMTVNLFCDAPDHAKNLQALETAFEAVAWLSEVHDGNVVAIAFKRAPSIDFEELFERASILEKQLGLPATEWVDELLEWMQ